MKFKFCIVRSGINISNIGPRLNYESGAQKVLFQQLEVGAGLDIFLMMIILGFTLNSVNF